MRCVMKNNWETIVGNVGTVYTGTNGFEARKTYSQYVAISKNGLGHAGHENVTLMKNDETNPSDSPPPQKNPPPPPKTQIFSGGESVPPGGGKGGGGGGVYFGRGGPY